MSSAANRGKFAEGEFRKTCKRYSESASFAFHRFPDAHAGSLVTAPADFQTLYNGRLRMIEVKETAEQARLPYKNFASEQVARMRLWQLAGGDSWVIVYHTETKLYRCFGVDAFLERDPKFGSWFFEPNTRKAEVVLSEKVSTSLTEIFKFIHGM